MGLLAPFLPVMLDVSPVRIGVVTPRSITSGSVGLVIVQVGAGLPEFCCVGVPDGVLVAVCCDVEPPVFWP